MTTSSLTIVSSGCQTDLHRSIARLALAKSTTLIGSNDFRDAAKVMGKQLSPETLAMLSAINAIWVKDAPSNVLEWLQALGDAICE